MTQARIPLTFAQAMTRVAGQIGYETAAILVRRSERTIYEWARPSTGTAPTIAQAAALDAAHHAAGGEGAPFLEAYQYQLDRALDTALACQRELAAEVASFARESGEAIEAAIAVTQGKHCHKTVYRALGEAEQAQTKMGVLIRRLTSFLTAGAGPSAGITGGNK